MITEDDRLIIAATCLQGLLSNPVYNCTSMPKKMATVENTAKCAVNYADALIRELKKKTNDN